MSKSDFWASIKQAGVDLEHQANLRGMTRVRCTYCKNGYESPGYAAFDGNGSFWVEGIVCRVCGGFTRNVEIPCTAEQEVAAIRVEIRKYRARLREIASASLAPHAT